MKPEKRSGHHSLSAQLSLPPSLSARHCLLGLGGPASIGFWQAVAERGREITTMEINSRMPYCAFVLFAVVFAIFMPASVRGHGHDTLTPAPAPAPVPTSDGTTIDQGIACVLMLLALVLTYLIHTLDVPFGSQV